MFCGQCGTEASEGDRYCSSCGRLLGDTPTGAPREVATGGEPGLSWAGRGPASVGSGAASDEQALVPASEAVLAGFWLRLGAFAIDMAAWWGFSLAVAIVVVGIYFGQNGVPEDGTAIPDADLERMSYFIYAIVWPLEFVATWWFNSVGWSLGKRAVGLRIIGETGRRPGYGRGFARTLGAWLSWLSLGLGVLWAAWDRRGQTWHDKMAQTYVVRADSLREHHDH